MGGRERSSAVAFPRMRWAALAWVAVWLPAYATTWGWRNFLQLCDVAVVLTAVGLWRGSALLLSSQALGSLVIDALWTLDVAWRAGTGHHLIGGTAYMWDASFPLPVRLLSLFHVFWPVLLLWSLRHVGYDRRALFLQAGITVAVMALARAVGDPMKNPNFAFRDPFRHRSFQPAALHVVVSALAVVAALYVPTHVLFARLFRRPAPPARSN